MKNSSVDRIKLLYVAPRYHTNQVPIMQGFHQCDCQVMFLAQYEGVSEVHDYVDFRCLKQSWISKCLSRHIVKKHSPNQTEGKRMHFFIPAFFHTLCTIKKFQPDLVIMRERYITNAVIYFICRILRIKKCILYVQQPIYDFENSGSKVKNFLKGVLFPKAAFSPIYYHGENRSKIRKSNVYFVPLVVEGKNTGEIEKRDYLKDGILHFLDVGKYRDYKNHFFLIDAFSRLKEQSVPKLSQVKLTIIGQVSNSDEEAYFTRLKQYVVEKGLENVIELRKNIPFRDMEQLYLENDVLLLPSTYESAGMVILEAMEMGLCVAASIYCGLSSYLEEYQCGYTFALDSTQELEEVLLGLIKNPETVEQMGKKGYETVHQHFLFQRYLEELNKLTEKEFGYTFYRE